MRKTLVFSIALATILVFSTTACSKIGSSSGGGSVTSVEWNAFAGNPGPGGGKIFYYSKEGFPMTDTGEIYHYLESAPDDMHGLGWASSRYTNTNINGMETGIGTGRKNTAIILDVDTAAPAAKACKDYSGGGKTDWFLPSKDELNMLYISKNHVGGFGNGYYWSSSQYGNIGAWCQSFRDGFQGIYSGKGNTLSVRAVRAF
jgi:hypothetical protein